MQTEMYREVNRAALLPGNSAMSFICEFTLKEGQQIQGATEEGNTLIQHKRTRSLETRKHTVS